VSKSTKNCKKRHCNTQINKFLLDFYWIGRYFLLVIIHESWRSPPDCIRFTKSTPFLSPTLDILKINTFSTSIPWPGNLLSWTKAHVLDPLNLVILSITPNFLRYLKEVTSFCILRELRYLRPYSLKCEYVHSLVENAGILTEFSCFGRVVLDTEQQISVEINKIF